MSNELDMDRKVALDQLTPEERAAIEDDDMTAEERAALTAIAGEGDDDDDDEEGEEEEDKGTPAAEKPAAVSAMADQTVEDGAAPGDEAFRPAYKVALPEDYKDQVDALDTQRADLAGQFKAGEIDFEEFLVQGDSIASARRDLDTVRTKAEIAAEMGAQTAEQEWAWTVQKFMRDAKKTEGVDYGADEGLNSDLDAFVKVLANNPANADKPMDWFLAEAHRRNKVLHGLGKASAPGDLPKLVGRKPNLAQLPATLAHVPGGDGPGDISDEFANVDKLEGLEYETAIKKMTTEQRDRYMLAA